jgi:hypothetical protein
VQLLVVDSAAVAFAVAALGKHPAQHCPSIQHLQHWSGMMAQYVHVPVM